MISKYMKLIDEKKECSKVYKQNIKKYNYKLIFQNTSLVLFIFAYIFYLLSLEKCYEGFDLCGLKTRWIKKKIYEAVISCFLIMILIEFIFYKIISVLNLLHIILFYILVYLYSHGIDFEDHGYYNFLGSIALIIILLFAISPLNCLLYIIKLNNKIYLIIFILFAFIIWIIYIYFSNYIINSDDWKYGLNNTFIENNISKHGCKIIIPKTFTYKIGTYFFDKIILNKNNCKETFDTKKKLIEFSNHQYLNIKTKRIGFPLPNKNYMIHMASALNSDTVKNFFKNNIIDLDNKTLVKKLFKNNEPEIIIDYNHNKFGELIINLQFNQTLSKERKKFEKNSSPYSDNLIIIFIDSVSRANSIRTLKKTLKFFEMFMKYKGFHNPNYPSENFHSFQFFKYHSFKHFTRHNYPPIFYGRVSGKLVRNIKYLKENG